MAVTVTNADDARLRDMLLQHDPFQKSIPCWRQYVWALLPPETIDTTRCTCRRRYNGSMSQHEQSCNRRQYESKVTVMAIRTVEATAAPARLFKRGGISSKQDYIDLLTALNNVKPTQALIVDMDPKAWLNDDGTPMKKPEVTFANSLRRRFEASGVAVTAYMSGTNQITVRRFTAMELKEREAGKGKRGRKSK